MPPRFSTLYQRLRNLIDARSITAQASALVAGKWLQEAFRFLLLLWLARTSQSGFGLFIFGAGIAAIIRSILTLGFDQFTIRELAWDRATQGKVLGQMFCLKLLLGLPVLVGILAFGWLQHWTLTETLVVLIISGGKILDILADTFFSFYRVAERQVQEAACSVKAALVGALYGAAALWLGGGIVAVSLFVLISGGLKVLLAAAGGMRIGLLPQFHVGSAFLPPGRLGAVLLIAGMSFLGSFYNHVQILLLKYFTALSDLALYGVALELAGGLANLVTVLVIGGVLYPALARSAAQGPAQLAALLRPYFWRLMAIGLGIAFFFFTLGKDLLLLLYGGQYAGGVIPLQIMGLALLFSFLNNFLIHAFLAQHQERLLFMLRLAPALLSLALGVVLIPRLGATGAALNLLACRGVMALLILAAAHRHFRILDQAQVGAFLWGCLILAALYAGLLAVEFPVPGLPAVMSLIAYAWWTRRWAWAPQCVLSD